MTHHQTITSFSETLCTLRKYLQQKSAGVCYKQENKCHVLNGIHTALSVLISLWFPGHVCLQFFVWHCFLKIKSCPVDECAKWLFLVMLVFTCVCLYQG